MTIMMKSLQRRRIISWEADNVCKPAADKTWRRYVGCAFAAVLTVAAVWAQPPNTMRRCRTWVDPVLHVRFPGHIGDMALHSRTTYAAGDNDYSLRYDSDESGPVEAGGRHLDLYAYTHDGNPIPDGIGERAQGEIDGLIASLRMLKQRGEVYEKVLESGLVGEGGLPKSGLQYLWTSHVLKFPGYPKSHMSVSILFGWRNRFIKVRYSEPILHGKLEPCEAMPATVFPVTDALDTMIAEAQAAAKVDVYAIANPTNAFAALRRKWLGVEERVSQYDMPDYTERSRKLFDFMRWCEDKIEDRVAEFERISLEGIRLKTEPAIWHYNHACALALKGDREAAMQALERAIVSGFNNVKHMVGDKDLETVWKDPRFAKLLKMAAMVKEDWEAPLAKARVVDGKVSLDASNIYWGFNNVSYSVYVDGVSSNAIIYLDHNVEHGYPPASGMVAVEYAEELHDAGRDVGTANFHFVDIARECTIPTLLSCGASYRGNITNDALSVYGRICSTSIAESEANHLIGFNVLGIYGTGADYAVDGVDRLMAFYPGAIACYDASATDEFVRLCAEAYGAMDPGVRGKGGIKQVIGIVRRAQKCVKSEADFLKGIAQRPALSIGDIDRDRAIDLARNLKKPYPDTPYMLKVKPDAGLTPITDLWDAPYDHPLMVSADMHACAVARWAERTGRVKVNMEICKDGEGGKLVWKVLQGDVAKVRFRKLSNEKIGDMETEAMEIAVDYHAAFDVPLADGKTIKTSRVDIGCFRVEDGIASVPAVVSVMFSPNETREYDKDGRLVSVDYTRRQIANWRPWYCPKANFRDMFHWNADGKLTGWTRIGAEGVTNEFTREGLVVMRRDSLGRPTDVRRSMAMEWMQECDGDVPSSIDKAMEVSVAGIKYDRDDGDPLKMTLAWQYTYANAVDMFGKPSPKNLRAFYYSPDLCRRADFTDGAGFRFPLVNQMYALHATYLNYKYDMVDGAIPVSDQMREDSVLRLKQLGLTPPSPSNPKKMRFCPWKPSTNDLWTIDMADFETHSMSNLIVLADGACRMRAEKDAGYLSVQETYLAQNIAAEDFAYAKLDARYRRCDAKTTVWVAGNFFTEEDWNHIRLAKRRPMGFDEPPKGITREVAMWMIQPTLYLCIVSDLGSWTMGFRKYVFMRVKEGEKSADEWDTFWQLPSRDIGNAVIGVHAGNPAALNNMAALSYAEIANPMEYSEKGVVQRLERAMKLGCAMAAYNLGVLYENRGEAAKAKEHYAIAESMKGKGLHCTSGKP